MLFSVHHIAFLQQKRETLCRDENHSIIALNTLISALRPSHTLG